MVDEFNQKVESNDSINILLVEDSEADVKITIRAFAKVKLKNKIYVVSDGAEALDFIYHQGQYRDEEKFPTPDLILLDIKLPKVDGFQVLEKIKGDLEYNFIPVIMLTSSRNEEDVARSYSGGAASFIPKPVSYEQFVKVVEGFTFYWRMINKLPSSKTKAKRKKT
ncbi:response regulator [Candidatus Omnitrophota bacterium]